MISTKEELKNVIELEKKGYDRNSDYSGAL